MDGDAGQPLGKRARPPAEPHNLGAGINCEAAAGGTGCGTGGTAAGGWTSATAFLHPAEWVAEPFATDVMSRIAYDDEVLSEPWRRVEERRAA